MIKVEKLNPFGRMCISLGMLPSSYKESMTYEEQLLWFFKFLDETVIPTVNNNAEAVEELQALYIQVKTFVDEYFDNLDVQEEINTKLDDMAESGELTDIIAQYLGLAGMLTFDTVSDMKLAENLTNGSICETLGYHSVNDGGSAKYKVRNITNEDTPDDKFIIALNDENLIAELILDELNIKQLGAYGDDEHDDVDIINYAIEYVRDHNINYLYFPVGTYKTTKPIILYDYVRLIGENEKSTIIHKTSNTLETLFNTDSIVVYNKNSSSTFEYPEGQEIDNISLKGNGSNVYGIYSNKSAPYSKVKNCRISNVQTCIYYTHGGWLFELSDLHLSGSVNGIQLKDSGTSLFMKNIYVISGSGYGYDLNGITYSSLNNICCDFITGTPYKFDFCNFVINGLGCECPNVVNSIAINNCQLTINDGYIIGNPSSSDYKCIAINGSSSTFNDLHVYTSSDNFAGQFLADASNVTAIFNNLKIDKPFLTANRQYSYNTVIINDEKGSFTLNQKSKFSGLGNTTNGEINNNGNFNFKTGGIFFNNYGGPTIGYDYNREWDLARKYGDIFINQAPLKNGVFAYQQTTDNIIHSFVGTISSTDISGTSGTITLTALTLDSDAVIKGIKPASGLSVTSSSGGKGTISSVNTGNNTLTLNNISGSFNVNDTLTLDKKTAIRDNVYKAIQYIGYGSTNDRPSSPVNGMMYWDTTLGKAIWYVSGSWKDATGTNV